MKKLAILLFAFIFMTCVGACSGKSSSSSDDSGGSGGGGGGGSDVFCFNPQTASANSGDTVSFTLQNGTPPYQFGYVNATDIQSYSDPSQIQATFDSNTGVGSYAVGQNSDCTDKIAAQDSTSAICYLTITVGSGGGGGGGGGGDGAFTNPVTVPCHWGTSCPTPVLDQATFNGTVTGNALVDTGAGNTSIVSSSFKSAAGIGSTTSFSVTDPDTSATYSLSSVSLTLQNRGIDVAMGRHFYSGKFLSINYDDKLVTFADDYSVPSGANSVPGTVPGSLGYFLVQGTVSGNSGTFVVDTGGDITIFCSELRAKINNVSGSPGGTRNADQMVLNGVTYTNIKHYDSSATPADTLKSYYNIDGLIGATFLARFHRATFDYKNSKLILEE